MSRIDKIKKLRSFLTGHIPLPGLVFITEGKGIYTASKTREIISEDELQLLMARRSLITGTEDGNVLIIRRTIISKNGSKAI